MPARRWTAEEAVEEYRRLTRELGRFPPPTVFEQRAAMAYGTLLNKCGGTDAIRERMRGPEGSRWDEAWLAEEWGRARVAVAERSSQLQTRTELWDVAWVFEHDWAGAPRKVLSYRESEAVRRGSRAALAARGGKSRLRRTQRATREEMLEAMRVFRERGEDCDLAGFLAGTGLTGRDVYLEFASWAELRREAGCRTARKRRSRRIPDEALLDAIVKLRQELGRQPTLGEIERRTPFSDSTYRQRFGGIAEIARRGEIHAQWLECQAEAARERANDPTGELGLRLFTSLRPVRSGPTAAEEFAKLKVGYALTSRMTKEWSEKPDILVCVQHDWAGYPRWVVEVLELRGGR